MVVVVDIVVICRWSRVSNPKSIIAAHATSPSNVIHPFSHNPFHRSPFQSWQIILG
jgi:hypothetical protein